MGIVVKLNLVVVVVVVLLDGEDSFKRLERLSCTPAVVEAGAVAETEADTNDDDGGKTDDDDVNVELGGIDDAQVNVVNGVNSDVGDNGSTLSIGGIIKLCWASLYANITAPTKCLFTTIQHRRYHYT